jgi:hypothetical protein
MAFEQKNVNEEGGSFMYVWCSNISRG